VLAAIGGAGCVGQVEAVHFHYREPTQGELFGQVSRKWLPHVQLKYVDAIERVEISDGELEECPLIALQVHSERAGERGEWVGAGRVEQFDPEVYVAI
jgi:hypothetical protein